MPRSIVHLDADAFFATVMQASDVRLRGKPIAVGGEKRGIVASASYEARASGVYTPMPTLRAKRLCPKLIVVPGDFERFEQFSQRMFEYVYEFTPDVEITSIDEGYFDLSGARKTPLDIAETIRSAIYAGMKVGVSEGIGANKLVSQIASKLNKPRGFCNVPPGGETAFLHPLPNRWLPGVGPETECKLVSAGLARIGQISATPLELLQLLVGSLAKPLKEHAAGIDQRPLVQASEPAKSYSHQETFAADQTDEDLIETTLKGMAESLMAKVRKDRKSIRTLTVKIRYNDMDEDQAGESLLEPTDLETDIYGRIRVLFKKAWRRRVSLRMVSLRLSNIYETLFPAELVLDRASSRRDAERRLAKAVDGLRESRGPQVIFRGYDMGALKQAVRPLVYPEKVRLQKRFSSFPRHYLPLNVHSYYSFLNSTLSIDAVIKLAQEHELPAIALTDDGNLHGAAEFMSAAGKAGIKPILGARVKIAGLPALLYVESAQGYKNLCRLLSLPGEVQADHINGQTEGLVAVSCNPLLARFFPGRFYFALTSSEQARNAPLGFPIVPALICRYARPHDREKFNIVQSIRTLTLLKQEHPEKILRGNLHFRSPKEMQNLFAEHPDALRYSNEIAERCSWDFPFGKPQFPPFKAPDGSPPKVFLRKLVMEGLECRYKEQATEYQAQIEQELGIIAEVGYEEYFLVVWDILQDCRKAGIEWITRGSAADSMVCYCLGISGVCPIRFDLYFKRFLNKDRMSLNKLPDIDVDFPHDRKDDVIDLLFKRYGPDHCAVVGGFSTYKARGAVGDIAKVLGVSEFHIRRFTERIPYARAAGLRKNLGELPECRDLPVNEDPYQTAIDTAEFLDGFPRYPKMHPCGVVLSRQPIHELAPTFIASKGYRTTHFDMDSVELVGLVKMDVLAQGGLAVMRDVKEWLVLRGIQIDLEGLEPWQDPEVWEMIAGGGARAVHHIESPAMISLCRMCNVREIDGLIAIVSVIRPGAANESKKLKFTRRYQKLEPVEYVHPSLESALKSTFGLVVYEEHILQICEAFAGLSPGRADVLRRALVKEKQEVIEEICEEFVIAAKARGRSDKKIAEVWGLVAGFSGYAFCKAHSTAYGVEAYQSAWLKRNHPVEFMAAVLSNGKGFYQPLVYVLECHRLGIELLPPSVGEPGPSFIPKGNTIRVPLRYIKGIGERTNERILAAHKANPFQSLADFYRRVYPSTEEMEAMLQAGAFDCLGKQRTKLFWECQFLTRQSGGNINLEQAWLLPPPEMKPLPQMSLEEPTRRKRLEWETELLGFSVTGHPLELHDHIAWETYCPLSKLGEHIGQEITTCGLIIEDRLHHEITGEPMKFLTLADRTDMVETELFSKTYKSYGLATVRYPVLEVTATVEPFENGRGYSLRVHRAGKPRVRSDCLSGRPRQ